MNLVQEVKQKVFNCRIGRKYLAPKMEIERITESEYVINGHTVFKTTSSSGDEAWLTHPPVNDVYLSNQIHLFISKLKKCSTDKVCSAVQFFGVENQCSICKVVK